MFFSLTLPLSLISPSLLFQFPLSCLSIIPLFFYHTPFSPSVSLSSFSPPPPFFPFLNPYQVRMVLSLPSMMRGRRRCLDLQNPAMRRAFWCVVGLRNFQVLIRLSERHGGRLPSGPHGGKSPAPSSSRVLHLYRFDTYLMLSRPKAARGLKLGLWARPFRTTLLLNANGFFIKH